MRVLIFTFLIFNSVINIVAASPKISFDELMKNAEHNSSLRNQAHTAAAKLTHPVTIMTSDGIIIDAIGVESGKPVYAVITDPVNIYRGGFSAFYEDIVANYNLETSKIIYADGKVIDNSGGKYTYELSRRSGLDEYLMVVDWTFDRVYLFSKVNGDLVDTAFIPSSTGILASPKMAMQHFNGRNILISDQITDGVWRFDTSGAYLGIFAPNTGVNTAILDNIRGIRYRFNNNLLVNVASGASQNTIQQFDTAGAHIGTFISTNLNSPFDILIRANDMLITNSSGTNRITRFDLNGNFLTNFYTGTSFAFPQQMYRLQNGNILVAAFSTPSGIAVLDSNGVFQRLLSGATGLRSVYLLDNGRYLVTNAAGVHEVDSSSGTIIRTVVTGANYQYITLYNPNLMVHTGSSSVRITGDYKLHQNFPNPFNPSTTISYSIIEKSFVKIKVTDINGREIKTLVNQNQSAGDYSINFSGEGLASGIYYYSIEAGNFKQSKKMLLVK